jgi:hypothetical protein
MDVTPIIVDIETAPLLNVREFVDPPDLSDIKAPSNYVKQEAIDGFIEREKAKRLADFDTDCDRKAALDFNGARIVAVGLWTEQGQTQALVCRDEGAEVAALAAFWSMAKHRMIVGFRIREFDLPMIIQRSRYLGVPHPHLDLGRYARGNGVTDLYDLLTFNDLRVDWVVRRTAKSFARRFGIPVTDAIDGKDIPALVAAGDWDAVRSHVTSDVELELALARRLGVVAQQVAEAVL